MYDYARHAPAVWWPSRSDPEPEWEQLFPGARDGAVAVNDSWLTPRTACKLFHAAQSLVKLLSDKSYGPLLLSQLPLVCRPFITKGWWVHAYLQCLRRIAARLAKGMPPKPNCTGEEMVLHSLLLHAAELESDDMAGLAPGLDRLPVFKHDGDFDLVRRRAVQDQDVLMLYDMDDLDEEEEAQMFNDYVNLHPAEWFIAFNQGRVKDHLPHVALEC